MKKRNCSCLWCRTIGLIRRELEATIAVLVVLAFIFGYSFAAEAPLDSGDATQVIQYADSFVINGVTYQGLNFTASNQAGFYRVRTGYDKADIITTVNGTRGATDGATYTFQLNLSQPISSTVYVQGDYQNAVSVNGTSVTNATTPIRLIGSSITIKFKGGDSNTITRLSKTPGSIDNTITGTSVAELYILPATANVEVNSTRFFQVIALDANGRTISPSVRWSITKGSQYATINPSTGELKGTAVGGPVTILASVNGKTASASVTVKEASSATTLKQIMEQTGSQTTTRGELGNEETTRAGFGEGGGAETEATRAELGNEETESIPSTGGISTTQSLDAFTNAQKQVLSQEKTYVSEQVVQNILNQTTTTTTQRVIAKVQMNLTQVISDLKDIFVGSTKTTFNPATGKEITVKQPNVFQKIGSAIINLFTGGAGASQELLRGELGTGGEEID